MEPTRKGCESAGLKMVKGDNDMDEDSISCSVCMCPYDDSHLRPRTLPCGHTFCTICIDGLVHQNEILCPVCRVTHTVPKAGKFGVTYVIEDLIRSKRREAGLASSAPTESKKGMTQPAHSQAVGLDPKSEADISKATGSLLQEQEEKVLAAIRSCQEEEGQLNHYQATLSDWSGRQQASHDRLLTLVEQSNSARLLVRQEVDKVAAKRQQIDQGKQQLQGVLQKLRTATSRKSAINAIIDTEHHTDEERLRRKECWEVFPDMNTVTTVNKALVATEAAVKTADTEQCVPAAVTGDRRDPAYSTFTITEKFQSLMEPQLKAEDIRTVTQAARRLLETGRVFATHSHQGVRLHAKVTLHNGRPCLHCLQDQTVPCGAVILKMDELVPATPPCMVFMDLAWQGTPCRRVSIQLTHDTPLGRQFILMSTGQRGPSYRNTVMWGLWPKGRPGEWVHGGDYETNNGRGGTALLPDLCKGEYRETRLAGAVFGQWKSVDGEDVLGTLFGIRTRDMPDDNRYAAPHVFGQVVDGLEVVQAAANHHSESTIKEVTVVDCGVVVM